MCVWALDWMGLTGEKKVEKELPPHHHPPPILISDSIANPPQRLTQLAALTCGPGKGVTWLWSVSSVLLRPGGRTSHINSV